MLWSSDMLFLFFRYCFYSGEMPEMHQSEGHSNNMNEPQSNPGQARTATVKYITAAGGVEPTARFGHTMVGNKQQVPGI